MRVLWITNVPIPLVAQDANLSITPYGGWLVQLADRIRETDEISLSMLFAQNEKKDEVTGRIDGIDYYGFYKGRFAENKEKRYKEFENFILSSQPDVIHIFGTEKEHSYIALQVCKELGLENRVVTSIQGMVSVYAHHYYADIPLWVRYGYTIRDVIRGNSMQSKKQFEREGRREEYVLKHVQNVIGRTDWDEACTTRLNPKVHYYKNNETLRKSFYQNHWNYDSCKPHSIFCSQSTYPIKGIHYVLEALPEIIEAYPDTMLYISGENLRKKPAYFLSLYQKYLLRTIKKSDLENHVVFLGPLQETEMVKAYLEANVFVCPSSIENSPNSLGEAMLLGMPVVSSDVGGVKNMLAHNEEGYVYQHDAPYMLAYYIKKVFANTSDIQAMARKAQEHARVTHNLEKNVSDLYSIYKDITLRAK
jgi:glycosyltransferase involved in cell wall biosynthesis